MANGKRTAVEPIAPESLRPLPVEAPFTVVVDTPEQRPWQFFGLTAGSRQSYAPLTVKTVRAALPHGDYSILGHEHRVGIERKSLADLYASLTNDRARFLQRIEDAFEMRFFAVVIEASWKMIANPAEHGVVSQANPRSIAGSILALQNRIAAVRWVTADTPLIAGNLCYRMLERYWTDYHNNLRAEAATPA